MIIVNLLVFAIIIAFAIAKLEINIEGKDGWASNLPTWRRKSSLCKFLVGHEQVTGYHFWLNITMLIFMHFPFFVGLAWKPSLELKFFGMFFVAAIFEDFFWFMLNPGFGWRKFNQQCAPWHKWILGIPLLYLSYSAIAFAFIRISFII